jgi:hypothetical protein
MFKYYLRSFDNRQLRLFSCVAAPGLGRIASRASRCLGAPVVHVRIHTNKHKGFLGAPVVLIHARARARATTMGIRHLHIYLEHCIYLLPILNTIFIHYLWSRGGGLWWSVK